VDEAAKILLFERAEMNISVIAARLHKFAEEIDKIVEKNGEKNGDHDFPDEALKPLVLNLFCR
jgi:hypothetical protein